MVELRTWVPCLDLVSAVSRLGSCSWLWYGCIVATRDGGEDVLLVVGRVPRWSVGQRHSQASCGKQRLGGWDWLSFFSVGDLKGYGVGCSMIKVSPEEAETSRVSWATVRSELKGAGLEFIYQKWRSRLLLPSNSRVVAYYVGGPWHGQPAGKFCHGNSIAVEIQSANQADYTGSQGDAMQSIECWGDAASLLSSHLMRVKDVICLLSSPVARVGFHWDDQLGCNELNIWNGQIPVMVRLH